MKVFVAVSLVVLLPVGMKAAVSAAAGTSGTGSLSKVISEPCSSELREALQLSSAQTCVVQKSSTNTSQSSIVVGGIIPGQSEGPYVPPVASGAIPGQSDGPYTGPDLAMPSGSFSN